MFLKMIDVVFSTTIYSDAFTHKSMEDYFIREGAALAPRREWEVRGLVQTPSSGLFLKDGLAKARESKVDTLSVGFNPLLN